MTAPRKGPSPSNLTVQATCEDVGLRLDAFLARSLSKLHPELSRSRLQALLEQGAVSVQLNGAQLAKLKPALRIEEGMEVTLSLPEAQPVELQPEAIALDILYEDEAFLAINKPCGMVVHPAPGHSSGTLVHAVLAHCGTNLPSIGGQLRPGIVHRLDKRTSGIILVAKTDLAHQSLSQQFKDRRVRKQYRALVNGTVRDARFIREDPIDRDPHHRQRMAVVPGGRPARTVFETLSYPAPGVSSLLCLPETGRTHQIRVHLAAAGHPVLNDEVYGRKLDPHTPGLYRSRIEAYPGFLLHAWKLTFLHPTSAQELTLEAPLPGIFSEEGQSHST